MAALENLQHTVLGLLPTYGYAVLGVAALAGAAGVPLPVTLLLLAAGALSADGTLSLPGTAAVVLAAAVAGDCAGYFFGRRAGRPLLVRAGPRLGVTSERLDRIEATFERWGAGSVWLSRWLLTAAGPVVNLLAGMNRYHFGLFLAADIVGEALWAGTYVGLGWLFGDSWSDLEDLVGNVAWFAAAATVAIILVVVAWHQWRGRRASPPSGGSLGERAPLPETTAGRRSL